MNNIHICRFDTDLGELSKKDKGNPEKIKEVLRRTGRFSCFDICDTLAPMMDCLISSGNIICTGGDYPWTTVEIKETKER